MLPHKTEKYLHTKSTSFTHGPISLSSFARASRALRCPASSSRSRENFLRSAMTLAARRLEPDKCVLSHHTRECH